MIDIETVREAYQETGAKPISGRFITRKNGELYCCAIGAMLVAAGVKSKDIGYDAAVEVLKIPMVYLEGFAEGFDGDPEDSIEISTSTNPGTIEIIEKSQLYHDGVRDGLVTREVIRPLDPLDPEDD